METNIAPRAQARIIPAMLLLALMAGLVFSACPSAERRISLPAVVSGQEGGLLTLKVILKPGNGSVYTTIEPVVGVSTQLSEQTAVKEAFSGTGASQGECDVFFSFADGGGSQSVDGPSAGLAMTVALRSAILNLPLRSDIAMTGAILPGGRAGDVGGLIDKAQASARNGKMVFISPKQQVYENIIIRALENKYNFSAIEVSDVASAMEIATSNEGTRLNSTFKLENRKIPALLITREQNEDDIRFGNVARSINRQLKKQVEDGAQGPLGRYGEYFKKEIEQNEEIIAKGYAYTGANNAFLSQVDADFLTTSPEKLDVQEHAGKVRSCLAGAKTSKITENNLEWLAGAYARRGWAQKKLEDMANSTAKYDSSEEKYLAVRELYYALSWCEASGYMVEEAGKIGGAEIAPEEFEGAASGSLKYAREGVERSIIKDPDAAWHVQTAQIAYDKGDYLAAIYDSAYAIGVQKSIVGGINQSEGDISAEAKELADEKFSTLWGRTYQSQGLYIIAESQGGGKGEIDAYRVLNMAEAMDYGFSGIRGQLKSPSAIAQIKKQEKEESRIANVAIGLFAAAGICAILLKIGRKVSGK